MQQNWSEEQVTNLFKKVMLFGTHCQVRFTSGDKFQLCGISRKICQLVKFFIHVLNL